MPKIICATIHDKTCNILLNYYNLKDVPFFAKLTVKGELNTFINNIIRLVVNENVLCKLVLDENIKLEGFKMSGYVYVGTEFICTIIMNGEYDVKEIYTWVHKMIDVGGLAKFYKLIEELENTLVENKLIKIQDELGTIKGVLFKATADLLDRGERLDHLTVRSDDLGLITRSFKDDTKKLNRCCAIL
jgi:hypothetical protein